MIQYFISAVSNWDFETKFTVLNNLCTSWFVGYIGYQSMCLRAAVVAVQPPDVLAVGSLGVVDLN